jgi:hypothetical protein
MFRGDHVGLPILVIAGDSIDSKQPQGLQYRIAGRTGLAWHRMMIRTFEMFQDRYLVTTLEARR